METLRFLGWEPHMSVLEVVSAGIARAELLVPPASPRGQLMVARMAAPRDTLVMAGQSLDLAISCDNVAVWERHLGALGHFRALHGALRRGGILGVVEQRARDGSTFRRMMEQRAVTEEHVVALAEVAGFVLVSRSAINGEGKSGRMTLKFVKP